MRRTLLIFLFCVLVVTAWGLKVRRSALSSAHQAHAAAPTITRAPYDPTLTHQTIEFWAAQVRSDPQGPIALANLSQWYLRSYRETGDIADVIRAEQAARRSLAIRPLGYEALVDLSRSLMTQHRFAEALTAAQRADAINPQDSPARPLRSETYMELGNYKAAHHVLYDAPTKPNDTNAKALRARLWEIEGNPTLALTLLRQAQAEADRNLDMPSESVAWYHMRVGNVLAAMGRADDAAQSYQEALKLFPTDYRTLTALAKLATGRGDWKSTVQWGQRAAAIVPTPEVLALIGDADMALGKPQDAARQYQLVEAIGTLARAQGVIYDRQRALFYADHNQHLDEALALARRELKQRQDIYAYDTYAWASCKKDLLPQAQSAMKQALAHGTQDSTLYYHAGMIAYARGDRATARRDLAHALTINSYLHPFAPGQVRTLLAKLG